MTPDGTRRWLITGANSGLGAAFTKAVLAEGDEVVAAVRRPESMTDTAAAHPDRVQVVALDVRDAAAAERAVKEAGRIDVLVNNAGYLCAGAVEEISIAEAKAQFETNYFGVVRMSSGVLPGMRHKPLEHVPPCATT